MVQNVVVTVGLLIGTIYCGYLVVHGTLKVKTYIFSSLVTPVNS